VRRKNFGSTKVLPKQLLITQPNGSWETRALHLFVIVTGRLITVRSLRSFLMAMKLVKISAACVSNFGETRQVENPKLFTYIPVNTGDDNNNNSSLSKYS
jgi:hypothetical protein